MTYWRIQDLAVIPLLLVSTQKIVSDGKNYQWYWGLLICALNLTFAKGAPFIGLFHAVYFFLIVPNKTLKTVKIIVNSRLKTYHILSPISTPRKKTAVFLCGGDFFSLSIDCNGF